MNLTQETKNLFAGLIFVVVVFLCAIIILRVNDANIFNVRQKLALVCLDNKKHKECQDEKIYSVR